MSYILRNVRPSAIQNWVSVNAPAALRATGRESWMAFLGSNGGTGKTLADLERSYLTSLLIVGSTYNDAWGNKNAAASGKTGREKAQNTFK